MPRNLPRLLAVVLAGSLPTVAQQPLGATFGLAPSNASRGGLLGAAGTLCARFDHDDCIGWGLSATAANTRQIRGVTFVSQDQNGATAENYWLVVMTESATSPGMPNLQAVATFGPYTHPATAPGVAVFTNTHVFPTPVAVPADRDVFIGVRLDPAPLWPNDGHSVQCALGVVSQWPVYDLPGPGTIQHGSYALAIDAAGAVFYRSTRQLLIDLLIDGPGGAATTVTNQSTYPASNAPPGIGGYLSGLHPDVRLPATFPGRLDDVGFVYLDTALPNGMPVFFLADLGNFAGEVRLDALFAGATGSVCLSPSALVLGLGFALGGRCHRAFPLPSALRPSIGGTNLLQQAIGLDPTFAMRASPCLRQQL